jgi:hypothetical protein
VGALCAAETIRTRPRIPRDHAFHTRTQAAAAALARAPWRGDDSGRDADDPVADHRRAADSGPFGFIGSAIGLALVLRNSHGARKRYVAFKRRHPKAAHWVDMGLRRRKRPRPQ